MLWNGFKRIGLFFFYLRRLLFAIALVLYGPHLFKKLSETQTEQYSFVNREVNHHVKLTSRKKSHPESGRLGPHLEILWVRSKPRKAEGGIGLGQSCVHFVWKKLTFTSSTSVLHKHLKSQHRRESQSLETKLPPSHQQFHQQRPLPTPEICDITLFKHSGTEH